MNLLKLDLPPDAAVPAHLRMQLEDPWAPDIIYRPEKETPVLLRGRRYSLMLVVINLDAHLYPTAWHSSLIPADEGAPRSYPNVPERIRAGLERQLRGDNPDMVRMMRSTLKAYRPNYVLLETPWPKRRAAAEKTWADVDLARAAWRIRHREQRRTAIDLARSGDFHGTPEELVAASAAIHLDIGRS